MSGIVKSNVLYATIFALLAQQWCLAAWSITNPAASDPPPQYAGGATIIGVGSHDGTPYQIIVKLKKGNVNIDEAQAAQNTPSTGTWTAADISVNSAYHGTNKYIVYEFIQQTLELEERDSNDITVLSGM